MVRSRLPLLLLLLLKARPPYIPLRAGPERFRPPPNKARIDPAPSRRLAAGRPKHSRPLRAGRLPPLTPVVRSRLPRVLLLLRARPPCIPLRTGPERFRPPPNKARIDPAPSRRLAAGRPKHSRPRRAGRLPSDPRCPQFGSRPTTAWQQSMSPQGGRRLQLPRQACSGPQGPQSRPRRTHQRHLTAWPPPAILRTRAPHDKPRYHSRWSRPPSCRATPSCRSMRSRSSIP
mmetsp:Transcript_44630/g.135336  ORF Transcript_44630/g.135336 Transcript_44630/m.135336 type:complete len:231 (-) Transcript_44630:2-694(-)